MIDSAPDDTAREGRTNQCGCPGCGTQGGIGHLKKDRMFELIERMRLSVVAR